MVLKTDQPYLTGMFFFIFIGKLVELVIILNHTQHYLSFSLTSSTFKQFAQISETEGVCACLLWS